MCNPSHYSFLIVYKAQSLLFNNVLISDYEKAPFGSPNKENFKMFLNCVNYTYHCNSPEISNRYWSIRQSVFPGTIQVHICPMLPSVLIYQSLPVLLPLL